jgi:transglutaminase-like putative cysteine protease
MIRFMQRRQISHLTEYRFPSPVSLLPHRLLLRPRESHNVHIESSVLEITPQHTTQWKRDAMDNSVAVVKFNEPSDLLSIASTVIIQHYDENPFDFLLDDYAVMHPFSYAAAEEVELGPFLQSVYPSDRAMIQQWLQTLALPKSAQTFALLDRVNREISSSFSYQAREEPGVQSPATTLTQRSGSCRDFTALFIEACRHLGLASRFVSGYLFIWGQEPANASTHAWAEVYLPGAGWKGFDSTSGEVTGDRHIAVAVARHPEAVPPVAGDYIGRPDQRPFLNVTVRVSVPND